MMLWQPSRSFVLEGCGLAMMIAVICYRFNWTFNQHAQWLHYICPTRPRAGLFFSPCGCHMIFVRKKIQIFKLCILNIIIGRVLIFFWSSQPIPMQSQRWKSDYAVCDLWRNRHKPVIGGMWDCYFSASEFDSRHQFWNTKRCEHADLH